MPQSFLEKVVLDIYIYIYLGKLSIVDKVIWGCMSNLGGDRKKTKCDKMNVHPFTNKLR
jgi:hypothetical protein